MARKARKTIFKPRAGNSPDPVRLQLTERRIIGYDHDGDEAILNVSAESDLRMPRIYIEQQGGGELVGLHPDMVPALVKALQAFHAEFL